MFWNLQGWWHPLKRKCVIQLNQIQAARGGIDDHDDNDDDDDGDGAGQSEDYKD